MKRYKRIGILLGVLVAVCVAVAVVLLTERHEEKISATAAVILDVDSADVQSLRWTNDGESFAFHREDGVWHYDDDDAFPADTQTIDEMLAIFQEFDASFVIDDVEDYGQYGLDDPICTIDFATQDASYTVDLGDFSVMDEQRYVSIQDGKVYLVNTDPLVTFGTVIQDLIDNDDPPVIEELTSLTFTGKAEYTIVRDEESTASICAQDVYFTGQDEQLPLDTSLVDGYAAALQNLDLSDYVTYKATEVDLAEYGLDDPELTITADYTYKDDANKTANGKFTLSLSSDPAYREKAQREDAENPDADADTQTDTDTMTDPEEEEITAYARVGDSALVYKISSSSYKSLMAAGLDDLRHKELLTADFADVTQVDVVLDGTEYRFTAHGSDEDRVWRLEKEEVAFADLQTALSSLRADSFVEQQPTDKQEIALTVHLDNQDHPTLKIELYRLDGSECLAVVDGEPLALVPRPDAMALVEAVNAIVLK